MKYLDKAAQFTQIALCCMACGLFCLSIFTLIPEIKKVTSNSTKKAVQPGFVFNDLKENLKSFKTVGFLTSKDTSSEKNDGEFLMAQYAMAPISLDLNNVQKVNIISPTDKEDLMAILKKNNLKPISVNKYGKTIAVKIK